MIQKKYGSTYLNYFTKALNPPHSASLAIFKLTCEFNI